MPLVEKFIDGEGHLALNGLLSHRVVIVGLVSKYVPRSPSRLEFQTKLSLGETSTIDSSDIGLWIAPKRISRETLSHSDITELSHGRCKCSRLVLI